MTGITAKIEGLTDDNGVVRALAFEVILASIRRCISHVDRCVSDEQVSFEVGVTPLKEGSIITSLVAIAVSEPQRANAEQCFDVVGSTLRNLASGEAIDNRLDRDAIEAFATLYAEQAKRTGGLKLGSVKFSPAIQESIDGLLGDLSRSFGSVSGVIEKLDVHGRRKFVLYSPLSTKGIECVFSESEKEKALKAVEKHVTVYGDAFYEDGALLPYKMRVDSIDVHPSREKLPSLKDALGLLKVGA